MRSARTDSSDSNRCVYDADFLKLARELDISESVLEITLDADHGAG